MRIGINLDKNVIIALHAHGISADKIAEYLMRDAAGQVTVAVNKAVTELTTHKEKS